MLSLGCHPRQGCHPTHLLPVRPRFSTILCQFAHKFFFFGCHPPQPLEGVTRGGPPPVSPPLVTPLVAVAFDVLRSQTEQQVRNLKHTMRVQIIGLRDNSDISPYSLYVFQSSFCLSVRNTFSACVYVLSGRISMKLATNIQHLSGHCWKGFQGHRDQRSRSHVYKCVSAIMAKVYMSTVEARLLYMKVVQKYAMKLNHNIDIGATKQIRPLPSTCRKCPLRAHLRKFMHPGGKCPRSSTATVWLDISKDGEVNSFIVYGLAVWNSLSYAVIFSET